MRQQDCSPVLGNRMAAPLRVTFLLPKGRGACRNVGDVGRDLEFYSREQDTKLQRHL